MVNRQRLTTVSFLGLALVACVLAAPFPQSEEGEAVVKDTTAADPTTASSSAEIPEVPTTKKIEEPIEEQQEVATNPPPKETPQSPETSEAVTSSEVIPVTEEAIEERKDDPPFIIFDLNKDGFVDPEEFNQVGRYPPESFAEADEDKDGLLSQEEFAAFFGSPLPQDGVTDPFKEQSSVQVEDDVPFTPIDSVEPSVIAELSTPEEVKELGDVNISVEPDTEGIVVEDTSEQGYDGQDQGPQGDGQEEIIGQDDKKEDGGDDVQPSLVPIKVDDSEEGVVGIVVTKTTVDVQDQNENPVVILVQSGGSAVPEDGTAVPDGPSDEPQESPDKVFDAVPPNEPPISPDVIFPDQPVEEGLAPENPEALED